MITGNGPLSRHRIQIWNKHQHPYRHVLSEFAYTNEAIPQSNNLQDALDYLIAVLYPLSQTAVATPADLPAGGNTLVVDFTTDTFTAAGHGYKDTDMVRIASTGTMPAPLLSTQSYFIKNATANTFQLALTPEPIEPVIDITTNGTGTITVENVLASYRVVSDDGDGKAAAYRWQKMPFDAAPKWYKVYDMDWSQDSILAAMMDVTQDLYVYQKGKQDMDFTGAEMTGVDAGQNVYGGAKTTANLNLYSNYIDPTTGFIQFGSQVAPKIHNLINLGENARRFINIYLQGVAQIGNTTYADGNIDAAGGVVDFNDNDITTTGDVAADDAQLNTAEIGNLNFATNSITSDSNIITMLNQTLSQLADVISQQVHVTDGVTTLALTVSALASIYNSSTGLHNFSGQDVNGIDDLTANNINLTTATIGNFTIGADDIANPNAVTFTMPAGATFTGALQAASVAATGASTGATGQFGNYALGATDITTVGANTDINLNPDGTGVNVFKKLARAVADATLSLGTAAVRWTTLFLSGGVSDGTNSISIAQLLSFRNANATANNGDTLFYDTATQTWLPSNPDTEIDHDTLNNLTTGDAGHNQFALLAGRAGGQSLRGGTVAGETLLLQGNAADATNGDVQFASHLTPTVDGIKDIGKLANRIRDLYATGENKGLREENTAVANNYGGASIGRKYFNTTVAESYADAGTFSKYPMYTDVIINSTLTGVAQTIPFSLEPIVRLTAAGLISVTDITIQADIRGNRYKFVVNDTGADITILNNANIKTSTGSAYTLGNGYGVLFFHDGTAWRMESAGGAGGGGGTNVQNTFSTPTNVSATLTIPNVQEQVIYITGTANFVSRTTPNNNAWGSVCWSPERRLFVAAGGGGTANVKIMTSPDGVTWTQRTAAADHTWHGVCWSPELGIFVATAATLTANNIMTSPDGITWTSRTGNATLALRGVCWSPQRRLFVAVATTGAAFNKILTSPDGITWTLRSFPSLNFDTSLSHVIWAAEQGKFVAVGSGNSGFDVKYSYDGITWFDGTQTAITSMRGLAYSPDLNLFICVGDNTVWTSANGINFTATTTGFGKLLRGACWCPEKKLFMIVATSGTGTRVVTTVDGTTMVTRTSPADLSWWDVCWSRELGKFAAVSQSQGATDAMTLDLPSFNATPIADGLVEGQYLELVGTDNYSSPKLTDGAKVLTDTYQQMPYLTFYNNKRFQFRWDAVTGKWIKVP